MVTYTTITIKYLFRISECCYGAMEHPGAWLLVKEGMKKWEDFGKETNKISLTYCLHLLYIINYCHWAFYLATYPYNPNLSRAPSSRDRKYNLYSLIFSIVVFISVIMATPVVTENDVSLETHTEREVGCTRHHNLILGFNAFVQAVANLKDCLLKRYPQRIKR